jgi:hypothetical protein
VVGFLKPFYVFVQYCLCHREHREEDVTALGESITDIRGLRTSLTNVDLSARPAVVDRQLQRDRRMREDRERHKRKVLYIGKSEIMNWLIVSEIVDFSSRAGLKSILLNNITKSIISDFPLF